MTDYIPKFKIHPSILKVTFLLPSQKNHLSQILLIGYCYEGAFFEILLKMAAPLFAREGLG